MIDFEADTIQCPVAQWARRMPELLAIDGAFGTFTYRKLDALIRRRQQQLVDHGFKHEDVVGTWTDNGFDLIALIWACLREGIPIAPVNPRFPADTVRDALALAGATAIFAPGRDAGFLPGINPTSTSSLDAVSHQLLQLDTIATIIFTSGSTGRPKAALLTVRNHAANAAGSATNIALEPRDRWLLSLPLFHVGGLAILFRCFLVGATVVIPSRDESVSEAVSAHGVTHLSLVATQLRRWLDAPTGIAVNQIAAVLLGGSAIPPNLIADALKHGLPIHTSYGMTEMGSQISTTKPGADITELQTSGYVLPHREVRIVGGRVQVRGATRFKGYLTEEGVEEPFDADGWFTTGDTGYFDEAGRLVVTGRSDDVFISAGENIQPRVIEQALTSIPGILQAVVVPVADDEYGARPVAFVDASGEIGQEQLRIELRRTLPGLFIPVAYYELPEPNVGLKVSRQHLSERAEELRRP